MSQVERPLKLFISYSHQDEAWREKLDTHLSLLRRQGIVDVWHDRRLLGGEDWAEAIDRELQAAGIVLLLVSADFINSDYCFGKEMSTALERHNRGEARVVPILLRACDWQSAPFGRCQAFPRDNKPVATHPRGEDGALTEVAQELRRLAREINAQRLAPASEAVAGAPDSLPQSWWRRHRRGLSIGSGTVLLLALAGGGAYLSSGGELRQGERYLGLGAYGRARASFAAALQRNPLNADARRGAELADLGALLADMESNQPEFSRGLETLQARWPRNAMVRVFAGDLAFDRFRRSGDGKQLDAALGAYQDAARLDAHLALAQERLGFVYDFKGDLPAAEKAWRRGMDLTMNDTGLAAKYRSGLAGVWAQRGRRAEALRLYDGDPNAPRSGIEAAMLRWQEPPSADALGQARDRLQRLSPKLTEADPAGDAAEAWGFKADGYLVTFGTRAAHRCLYGLALASTEHLLGQEPSARSALTNSDQNCTGLRADATLVVCDRLMRALKAGNPRAKLTRAWLGCQQAATG